MSRYLVVVLVLCLASAAVPQLTAENFFETLTSVEFVFVNYFSPGCEPCKALAVEYELLHQRSEGKTYRVFEVNCSEESQICSQANVDELPALLLYVSAIAFQYEGLHTSQAMGDWIEALQQTVLTPLSEEDSKKKKEKEAFAFVSGLTRKSQTIIAVAAKLHDTGIEYYSFQLRGLIGLYKPGLDQPLRYKTDEKFPLSLIDWAFEEGRKPISPLLKEHLRYLKRQQKFEYILGVVEEGDGTAADSLKQTSSWCASKAKDILCFKVNRENPLYEDFKSLGKVHSHQSTLFIAKKDFSIVYHFPTSSVTAQSLTQFFKIVKEGKAEQAIDFVKVAPQKVAAIEEAGVVEQAGNGEL